MTRILTALFCLLLISNTFSQSFIEENYQSYLDNENITRVQVGERMFAIASALTKDNNDKDVKDAHSIISKIKSFDLLSVDHLSNPQDAFKQGLSKCSQFDELIRVKDKNTNVSIRIDEKNDVIHQIIGLISNDSNFIVFNLVGEINLNEINSLINKIQDENVSKLLGGKQLNIEDVRVYPNPSKKGQSSIIDIPENLRGGKLNVFDSNGRVIQTYSLDGERVEINTTSLQSSTYMLKFEKGLLQVNKKLIVIE